MLITVAGLNNRSAWSRLERLGPGSELRGTPRSGQVTGATEKLETRVSGCIVKFAFVGFRVSKHEFDIS